MSLAYVAHADGADTTPADDRIATSSTLNVAAGDLLVAWVKWEDADLDVSSVAGATNTMTIVNATTPANYGGGPYGTFAYKIAAAANAAETFTLILSGSAAFKSIMVLQFRPDAGETVSLDPAAGNPNIATGTGNSPASGAIDSEGSDGVHVGGYSEYTDIVSPTWKIGSTTCVLDAAAGSANGSYQAGANDTWGWFCLYTANPASLTANGTCTSGSHYVCGIIGFQSVAGAAALDIWQSECVGSGAQFG